MQAQRISRVDGGGCCGTLATRWRLKPRARADSGDDTGAELKNYNFRLQTEAKNDR